MKRHLSRRRITAAHKQRGMALLIALVVLVVVTILGTVAMRTALFQNRVSINNQVSNLAFQSAESGLHAVMRQAAALPPEDPAQLFNVVTNTNISRRVCFDSVGTTVTTDAARGADGVVVPTAPCPDVANANSRVSTVVAVPNITVAMEATDTKQGGGEVPLEIRARAEVPNTNVSAEHLQTWRKQAPADTSSSEGG